MAHSKVVLSTGEVLIDLTGDTVEADKLLKGFTAHGADGEPVEGSCAFDVDSSGATAKVAEVLAGKTFAAGGSVKTGTVTVPQGYHDGAGKVGLNETEKAKLIPENIRAGVEVLGVTGTMSGTEDANPQAKEVTPSFTEQTVLPDTGCNYLSQVKVGAIPVSYADNAAGGTTVTIG